MLTVQLEEPRAVSEQFLTVTEKTTTSDISIPQTKISLEKQLKLQQLRPKRNSTKLLIRKLEETLAHLKNKEFT